MLLFFYVYVQSERFHFVMGSYWKTNAPPFSFSGERDGTRNFFFDERMLLKHVSTLHNQ